MPVPGPRGWWDSYRTSTLDVLDAQPVLPDRVLKPFVLHEQQRLDQPKFPRKFGLVGVMNMERDDL